MASVVACCPCVVLTLSRAEFKAWSARVAASEDDVTPVHARTRLESIPFISQVRRPRSGRGKEREGRGGTPAYTRTHTITHRAGPQMTVKTEGIGGKEFRLLGALDLLGSLFELEEWPPQAVVFTEGDEAEKFYIIASGAVKFSARGDTGRPVVLNVLQRDSYFGEIGTWRRGKLRPCPPAPAARGCLAPHPQSPPSASTAAAHAADRDSGDAGALCAAVADPGAVQEVPARGSRATRQNRVHDTPAHGDQPAKHRHILQNRGGTRAPPPPAAPLLTRPRAGQEGPAGRATRVPHVPGRQHADAGGRARGGNGHFDPGRGSQSALFPRYFPPLL